MSNKKKRKSGLVSFVILAVIAIWVIRQGGYSAGRVMAAVTFLALGFGLFIFMDAKELYPKSKSWKKAIWKSLKQNLQFIIGR